MPRREQRKLAHWEDEKRPMPSIAHVREKTSQRGWFLPQVQAIDSMLSGRWAYWLSILLNQTIGPWPGWKIPYVDFQAQPSGHSPYIGNWGDQIEGMTRETSTAEHLQSDLNKVLQRVLYAGKTNLRDVVKWWLWALDYSMESRPELDEESECLLYYRMDLLPRMMAHPSDWGSFILQNTIYPKGSSGTAWFPTPLPIVKIMTTMTMGEPGAEDLRLKSVNEPCCGTGVILLAASNYSLDLSGIDVDGLMVDIVKLQGYLFVPWLVYGDKSRIAEFAIEKLQRMIAAQTYANEAKKQAAALSRKVTPDKRTVIVHRKKNRANA